MNHDWLAHPIVSYALLATGLSFCLYLFVTLKREIQLVGLRRFGKHQALEAAIDRLCLKVNALEEAPRVSTEPALVQVPTSCSSINLAQRSKILLMSRRGERPEQISTLLRIPRNEVELLLKIHQLVLSHFYCDEQGERSSLVG